MARTNFAEMPCSIARTLEVVGEAWTLLVLRDAFYGVRRFEDFQRDLGIARNVLTDRLAKLVAAGVLERRQYEERPPRFEYRLTEKGRDLLPVLLTMMRWGARWESGEKPTSVLHATCGHPADPVVACGACGEELVWRDLRVDPVPVLVPDRG